MENNQSGEFDRRPVSANKLLPARHFAASYAGEHVAGTEFVIGATFVAWGVSTTDVIGGLLLGNLLAVLSWVLLCAPIATDTRLTLYAYLEKIAGPGIIRIYSIVNGIFFCVLGGAMITVSASAVRILFGIDPQVNWYPTSLGFVAVALLVGTVVVLVAMRGFAIVARFAEVCAPWMILMFAAGALAIWPLMAEKANVPDTAGFMDALWLVGDAYIWVQNPDTELSFWHVAAFAWVCNLPMHVGMSDMTVLRFARSPRYAWFSALGMYIGHFGAWICAGIMGAGAAHILKTAVANLDAGEVAFQVLGSAGIVAVIIAGWTTSNPTIYRAGLAFQSLNHRWSRKGVTIFTGAVTTVIACFPFVFTGLMDFLGLMGLLLAPVGAIIITEHWILPKLGMQRYWFSGKASNTNLAALFAWIAGLAVAWGLNASGVHIFFLLTPTWITAAAVYVLLAKMQGAADGASAMSSDGEPEEAVSTVPADVQATIPAAAKLARIIAWLSLGVCAAMAISTFMGSDLETLRSWLLLPSVVYFISATYWITLKEAASA